MGTGREIGHGSVRVTVDRSAWAASPSILLMPVGLLVDSGVTGGHHPNASTRLHPRPPAEAQGQKMGEFTASAATACPIVSNRLRKVRFARPFLLFLHVYVVRSQMVGWILSGQSIWEVPIYSVERTNVLASSENSKGACYEKNGIHPGCHWACHDGVSGRRCRENRPRQQGATCFPGAGHCNPSPRPVPRDGSAMTASACLWHGMTTSSTKGSPMQPHWDYRHSPCRWNIWR